MKTVQLMFVGGFLGAGKTTLLWRTAEQLVQRGKRVGLITNDQAPDLVDTKLLAAKGLNVREVAGSCFCCNFQGLIDAAQKLESLDADVLIGEPVGSCTDLSATILQPLKDKFKGRFVLSPLSVLADPLRLADVLRDKQDTLHASAAYIYRKQLEEADLLVINKADLIPPKEREWLQRLVAAQIPQAAIRFLSARIGEGLDPWLDEVLSTPLAGSRLLDIDYGIYAEGEAVLGWLNADIRLRAVSDPVEWSVFCRDLLNSLHVAFRDGHARIGHVKLLLSAGGSHCTGSLTGLDREPIVQGRIDGSSAQAELTLNARVEMSPEDLERVVHAVLVKVAGRRVEVSLSDLRCLRPGRPRPTYRYGSVAS